MTVFCSLDDVRSSPLVRIGTNFVQNDPQITNLIVTVSEMVRNYCRRKFDRALYVQYHNTTRRNLVLRAAEYPIVNDNTFLIGYDEARQFYDTQLMVRDVDYTVDFEKGRVTFLREFNPAPNAIKWTYTGGYEANGSGILQVPANIKQATATQTAHMYSRMTSRALGVKVMQPDKNTRTEYADTAPNGLLPEVQAMLSPYRAQLLGGN